MPCSVTTPLECGPGDVVGAIGGSVLDRVTESMARAVEANLELFTTLWLKVPSPNPQQEAVAATQQNLEWITLFVAACGLLVALVRIGVKASLVEAVAVPRMYLIVILVSAAGGTVVAQLLQAGDAMAPWLVEQATEGNFSSETTALIQAAQLTQVGVGPGLLLGALALLASALQVAAMFIRAALLLVLMAWLPTVAAASGTEAGMHRLKQIGAWIFAMVIYKPVAAVIYSVGFLTLQQDQGGSFDDIGAASFDLILGMTIILLAVIALPALIKFLVPIAARAGSGVSPAAAIGTVAAGAPSSPE